VEIYTSEINTTDNGSVVFRILDNLVDNGDRFLVTVDVAAVGELTTACCCRTDGEALGKTVLSRPKEM
jgi:hypothetical protein